MAVCRVFRRVLAFLLSDRSEQAGASLYEQLDDPLLKRVYTDWYPVYDSVVPPALHKKGKAGTFAVESMNSCIRHYLARLRRRTKCYSKSIEMMNASLTLLFWKLSQRSSWLNYIK